MIYVESESPRKRLFAFGFKRKRGAFRVVQGALVDPKVIDLDEYRRLRAIRRQLAESQQQKPVA